MISNLSRYWEELIGYRTVLGQLVRQHLILRYRRTALGYFWTLINPLVMMSVTAVVFSTLFNMPLRTYAVFLFAGMIPWNCFNSMVVQSCSSFIVNEGLIRKIYLPKFIFPLSVCLGVLIDSILSFIALSIIILLIGGKLSWTLLFIPMAFSILFLFSFGIALIVSTTTVFFRDFQHVIVIAMQAWFFLTPVMYEKEKLLRKKVSWLVALNPVAPLIGLFRSPLHLAALPHWQDIYNAVGFSILSVAFGLFLFSKQEKKIIFKL